MNDSLKKNFAETTLRTLAAHIIARIQAETLNPIWICPATAAEILAQVAELEQRKAAGEALPLYGHFFAVKDNIDVCGVPTTAGCPSYARIPDADAVVVQKARQAGAVYVGKTNMDQFATGLTGTRSPHGPCQNALHPDYISGGSSSGSAVAVARQMATFSLGTDTAGSGRIPAVFNGLIGYKPTRGLLSTRGVVPACRSLDCVSVFAPSLGVAVAVAENLSGFDPEDPFSRKEKPATQVRGSGSFRFGVPRFLEFFGDEEAQRLYAEAVEKMQSLGGVSVEVDFEPFAAAAELLYAGPWVAERYASVGPWIEEHPEACNTIVAEIIRGARNLKTVDAFQAFYRLQSLQRSTESQWEKMDFLLLPTAPTVYRIAEVQADPLVLNARLGTYTNFVNLLDLCALALPWKQWSFGVPFGVSLIAPAGADDALLRWGARFLGEEGSWTADSVTTQEAVDLAVVGAHLRGQPLHHQLTTRGAMFMEKTRTAASYRLYALSETQPPKPALVKTSDLSAGASIEVEIYRLSAAAFGDFVRLVPSPLSIGTVELEGGRLVKGFLAETYILESAQEITRYGSWLAYLDRDKEKERITISIKS
jgi:allophanate hydrolase